MEGHERARQYETKNMFQQACREATRMELILVGEIHLSSKNRYVSALLVSAITHKSSACLMREGCISWSKKFHLKLVLLAFVLLSKQYTKFYTSAKQREKLFTYMFHKYKETVVWQ
jgi:uncharacterized membrane protein